MKRHLFVMLLILILALSACGTSVSAEAGIPDSDTGASVSLEDQPAIESVVEEAATAEDSVIELTTEYENAASIGLQLVVGTFKLEETDKAISAEQAPALLASWNELKPLMEESMPQPGERGEPGEQPAAPEQGSEPQPPQEPTKK